MNNNNIITYLKFRGDLTFRQSPFNNVDALILTQLVIFDFSEYLANDNAKSLADIAATIRDNNLEERLNLSEEKTEFFFLAAESLRFGKIKILDYKKIIDEHEFKTFYAITYILSPFHMFVAFRGTDGSLISWKENFKTIYQYPTAGQVDASVYLNDIVKSHPFTKFSVGGHSKGGNLSVYASMFLNEKNKKRLTNVFSFDAPGFINDISETAEYLSIKDKIISIIPEGSVIGRLMNPPYENHIIESTGKDIYQHDTFTWQVLSTDFVFTEATNLFSDTLSQKVNNWIYGIPINEREKVVDELFDVFMKNNISHIQSLMHLDHKTLFGIIKSMVTMSSENKNLLMIILKELRA